MFPFLFPQCRVTEYNSKKVLLLFTLEVALSFCLSSCDSVLKLTTDLGVGGSNPSGRAMEKLFNMKKPLLTCACFVITFVVMAFVPLPAYAQRILYSISRDDDLLRVVNPSTGSTISSVAITLAGRGVSFGNGLATHPVTGELFALLKLDGQTGRQLVTINTTTGVATSIGDTGDQFAALAFNSSGTLFAVVGDKKSSAGGGLPPETLFTLNTSNAAPIQVLVLGRGNDGEAIGFNPNDGLIYHASGNDTGGEGCAPFDPSVCVEIFESVNPNTLAVTNISISGDYTPLTESYFEAAALTHLASNVLLVTNIDQNLYKITTTGVVTFVGGMDHVAKGLAFVNGPVEFKASSQGGGAGPVLAGGAESASGLGGLGRGPAFQLFNTAGTLQTTQFVLNPDFRSDLSFVLGNFDGDPADEVLVGARETAGLMRGPAYQLFETGGAFKLTRFVLNLDFTNVSFSSLNVGSNGVLVCGQETLGVSRGPGYQAFDASGNLVRTQFVLNPDFTTDNNCMGTNLDGVAGDEVIVGGREVTGSGRGPAYQVFGSDGSFRLTRFVLNPDFRETKFTVLDVGGSKDILVSGRETAGVGRGPAYQMFDSSGNFILTRLVLNPDFTDLRIFGANTTNGVVGEEIVAGGTETSGLARGPAIQVWDKNGNHLFTRFVLNPDFIEVKFSKIDINNDGVEEILVVGRETKGLGRGPAFQVFDGSGNLLVTQFVLNPDFTNLRAFVVDQNGDGDKEIGIGGIETKGLLRGPAYQIFESNGTLVQTRFVLNPDF